MGPSCLAIVARALDPMLASPMSRHRPWIARASPCLTGILRRCLRRIARHRRAALGAWLHELLHALEKKGFGKATRIWNRRLCYALSADMRSRSSSSMFFSPSTVWATSPRINSRYRWRKTMGGDLDSPLGHTHSSRDFGIGRLLAVNADLSSVKKIGLTTGGEFIPESGEHLLQQRQCHWRSKILSGV